MAITPLVREFADQVEQLLDARPHIDRSKMTLTTADAKALIRLPPVEIDVSDREAILRYGGEPLPVRDHKFVLRVVEAILDGKIEIEISHGLLWRTTRSYMDGSPRPFLTTRMPVPSLRPRTERRTVVVG
jgi:hypothetical protein